MKKKTVKKLGLLSLTAIMTMSMAACGATKEENTGDNQGEPAQETTPETQEAQLKNQVAEEDVPQLEGYELLWHDEFNGTTLDESNWTRELRDPGWTNNELQAYTDSDTNIYVQDGVLTLKAEKTVDENGNETYTSGKVNSQNKRDFMYGKVVARAKAPSGKGLWPAIWMMPQNEDFYGQWPKCGEIDIMEVLGDQTNIAYCTLHYGEPHGEQQDFVNLSSNDFADEFHEYSVEWEPGEIRWYIDGNLVLTANDWYSAVQGEDWKEYPAPFNQNFFVQMNLAVGGNWPGDPDENTNFDEAKFEIDYVRVYQKPEYDTNVTRPEVELRDPDESGNYVFNGDFSETEDLSDEENWQFLLFNGGAGEATMEDGVVTITSTDAGTEDYSVQFLQANVPMKQGSTYRVTFEAKADENRTMITCVSAPNVGWIRYLPDTSLDLTTEWQTYTYEFTMKDNSDATSRLEFNMGNQGSTATIYLANIRLEDITE